MARKKQEVKIPRKKTAEERVVGTMLCNADALKQALEKLEPQDFYFIETMTVFQICISLYDKGQSVGKKSITAELKKYGKFNEIGGEEYLDQLIEVSDAVLFSSNVSTVKNYSILRESISLGSKLAKAAMKDDADAANVVQEFLASAKALNKKADTVGLRMVSLEILTSNPSKYRLEFSNGEKLDIGLGQLTSQAAMKTAIINKFYFVPALAKDWEKFITKLIAGAVITPVYGADADMEVLDIIKEMFRLRGEATDANYMVMGSYALEEIHGERYYLFQKSTAMVYIRQMLDRKMDSARLWQLVYSWGGISEKDGQPLSKWKGKSSRTGLWGLPAKVIEEEEITTEITTEEPESNEADGS